MKKQVISAILLMSALLAALCGCGAVKVIPNETAMPSESILPAVSADEMEPTETPVPTQTPQPYPYQDEQGRTRHQLVINGEVIQTQNLPFSLEGEEGAYMPLEDVLGFFDITYLTDESRRLATGRVNGQVFKVQAYMSEITVGKSTLNSQAMPLFVDGCLYVPSFLFMELLDATVDFTADQSGATIVTDIAVDAAESTTEGLSLPVNTFGDGSVQLKLSAQEQSECAKLLLVDAAGNSVEVMEVFIEPNKSVTLYFSAGTYILKLASGNEWLGEEEAFGPSGSYSSTEAYTFEAGGKYELETGTTEGDFYSDSQSGFTGN